MPLVVALLRAAPGRSEELSQLLKRLIYGDGEEGVEVVSGYNLTGSYDALLVIKAEEEEAFRRFLSKIEKAVGSRAFLHTASPITT